MFRALACIALIAVFVIQPAKTVFAQDCKGEIIAMGGAAIRESAAKKNAIESWRRIVVARYGEFYADFEKAKESDVTRCARTMIKMWRCEAKGRPCIISASAPSSDGPWSASCTSNDSPRCKPKVKAVQLKLSERGCPTSTDGASGPGTVSALKCFQRKEKLKVTGNMDEETLAALQK